MMIQSPHNEPTTASPNRLSVSYGLRVICKLYKLTVSRIDVGYSWLYTYIVFKLNGVVFANDFVTQGRPVVNVSLKGYMQVGRLFIANSGKYNPIGRQQPCYFIVAEGATLQIGDNVGISCSAIVCRKQVVIHNNVRIGGNTVIYDTDFHSLQADQRTGLLEDGSYIEQAPVVIEENAFIGAHSTILKGVTIGRNSIIGAGSVVSKSIPANQIWAGNPAKFIRETEPVLTQ